MEIAQHIAALRRDGELLAVAAGAAGPDAEVTTCPEWRIRDLVRHVGGVHRWAAAFVAEQEAKPRDVTLAEVVGAWPDDHDLVEWFRAGHAHLVETLEAADPDVRCWTFLEAPSPLAFWARRQAHETAIHRVDAESALGKQTPCAPSFAADGIDELLFGFAARPGRSDPTSSHRTLALRATDAERAWLISIGPKGIEPSTGDGDSDYDADCSIRASAPDLYLLLWNRRSVDDLDLTGDHKALALWQEAVRIRWVD